MAVETERIHGDCFSYRTQELRSEQKICQLNVKLGVDELADVNVGLVVLDVADPKVFHLFCRAHTSSSTQRTTLLESRVLNMGFRGQRREMAMWKQVRSSEIRWNANTRWNEDTGTMFKEVQVAEFRYIENNEKPSCDMELPFQRSDCETQIVQGNIQGFP